MKKFLLRNFPIWVIVSMLFVSCSAQVMIPVTGITPTATTVLAPTETSTVQPSDDVWDRIVLNKKIVVGTSWDYPPFSSVDPNFKVVGFDIALIEEIGRRLQIPVEIQNYSFEGLPGALQVNQIDLAVAAIAITPERLTQMSFSPIYYVNQTAVLARNDALVPNITNFNQLAGFRVGVRRGTVYEKMAQNLLVDTGLMSTDKLLSYMQTDESVRDLLANRVDVVVLGEATASYYGAQQNLRVVGNGFHEQNLAVAMRLGTPRLKAEIDRVMDQMLTDGTILTFIQQYIQNDVAKTLSTPIPNQFSDVPISPLPTVDPRACVDGMKFISDVTFADNNMASPPFIKPGEGFVKTWRVQNTGNCTWTPSYHLVYAYGNVAAAQMSGQTLNIPANVTPGQTVDLSVTMTAPTEPLTYQGFWQMANDKNILFGQAIWVGISTGVNTSTPVATVQASNDLCVVTITAPQNPVIVLSKFDTVWTVKNISGEDWLQNSVDYKYISGTKMNQKGSSDFTQTIKNGESGKIVVGMTAPSTPGAYNTTWAIVSSNKTLCTLYMNVTVTSK